MNRRDIILIAGGLLVMLLVGVLLWSFLGEDAEQPSTTVEFTPPPISEDPPMSSDSIDQIMQEMEERGQ